MPTEVKECEPIFKNGHVYDVETFPNCFTLVARELGTKTYRKFVIHESRNDVTELLNWLKTKPILIGFNNLNFDDQILEYLWRKGDATAEELFKFGQKIIEDLKTDKFAAPYSEWDLSFISIDLLKINHYNWGPRFTSLKWLEFTTRWPKMRDLPLDWDQPVSKSKISQVLTYNRNDVDVTYDFFMRCLPQIELRKTFAKEYNERRVLNMSDSSLGSYLFKEYLIRDYGVDKALLKKGGTKRNKISIGECILPYIRFEHPDLQAMQREFEGMVVDAKRLKGVFNKKVLFEDMEFSFGMGGMHACYESGVYDSDDEHAILSIDVKSYYPNLAIANNFYPEHLGKDFCQIYRDVYNKRSEYEKGSAKNYALKILLNSVYGKSNSEYSYLHDPQYTLKITVNGQLLIVRLAERLSNYGRLLMVNTDGLEIRIRRDMLDEVMEECTAWELLTGLTLEHDEYRKLIIRDVNSYIAVNKDGKAKRKGAFEIYYDYTEEDGKPHSYHKNPSGTIIPEAVYEYLVNGVSIPQTILNRNNIHDFLYGIKKKKNFDYLLLCPENDGTVSVDKRTERTIRYYIAHKGATLYKHFLDERKADLIAVNKGEKITLAMDIVDERIFDENETKHYDVDYDYYIREAYELLHEVTGVPPEQVEMEISN